MIDARPAVDPRRTGVGHYTAGLLHHLPVVDPGRSFVAWYLDVRSIGSRPRRFAHVMPNLTEHASRIPSRMYGPVAIRTGFPRLEWLAGGYDLVLATNFLPPSPTTRGVLVVHDLAFAVRPETAPHHDARWRRRFAGALVDAAAVIVPSDAAHRDLLATHEVDPGIVTTVHHGTDAEAFRPASPHQVEELRRRLGIDGPYVAFLGGLEPRKNLERLIRAFALVDEQRVSLVVAGGRVRWAPGYGEEVDAAIESLPGDVASRIVRTGYVSDTDRRTLLSGAEVLAYPSVHEGFGFPILEGFAANVPVLTSSTSSLPEVAGDAAVQVDPDDVEAIAAGLHQLLVDDDLRHVCRAAGAARVASFTWERCARATATVLHGALERAQ